MIFKAIRKIAKFFDHGGKLLKKAMSWLFKMPDMPDAAAVMVEKQGSDHPIPVVYGTRKIGVIKVHKYVTDLSGGAQNELLHLICVLCEGEIDAIEEVFFDGVSENDQRWRKDKNNPNSAKWFTVHRYFGAANQTASAPAVSAIPNWTNNHTLNGLAYLYVVLQMDKDQSIWRGEPEITARVRGRKIFDPRTNTTAFSTNPAIQQLDYLQNPIYGKGLNQNRLDLPSFIAAANFADETLNSTVIVNGVPTPFSHKRFTGNQVVDTGKSVFSNVQQMLSAMRGSLPIGSGVLRLQLERDTSPVFYFSHGRSEQLNHATITGRIKSSGGSKKDRFNRVVVRFPNAAQEFERDEVFYPDSEDPQFTQWLAEDNGVLLEQNFEFNTITNKAEALQMARIIALRSRFQLQCSFTASPAAIVVEPGDVVAITDDTRGWDAKPFRVEQVKLKDDGDIDLEFIEHQNAIYPWSGTTYEERTGGTNLGDPTNIPAPTGLSITPDLTLATGGRLTWSTANNAFIRRFRVQLQSGSTVLFSEETAGRSLDLPLLAPGNYSISVFAISTLNTLSPPAVIAFELTLPVPPTSIQLASFNFEIEARPVLAGAGLGTQFEFDCVEGDGAGYTPTSQARGATATFVGLKHDTLHTIFARTINALGNSGWVSASIATTSDASNVIDLIKDPLWESTFQPVVDDLQAQIDTAKQGIVVLDNNVRLEVNKLRLGSEAAELELLKTTALAQQLRQSQSNLTNALFEVDPLTGQIRNLAYAYTDSQFTQAGLLIDGVKGQVEITSQRVTATENRLTNAESSLELLPGQLALKASYTEVNAAIASAIDAVLPAYSFGFFNSTEGWVAVNGSITPATSKVLLTLGDIANTSLDYLADDNPLISISIERTGGTGWVGSVIVSFADAADQTYTGVIEDVASGTVLVRNLNLGGEATYTGQVTGIRLILGATTADTFIVNSITIGKPSAALTELEGITAQVNQLGLDLNAVDAKFIGYVTTTFFNENAVTVNNLELQLNGVDGYASLIALQQELDAEGTLSKANAAAIWIDAADANITQAVEQYNARPGGLDDQLNEINDSFTLVQSQIDANAGLVQDQVVAISRLGNSTKDIELNQILAEYQLYLRNKGQLELKTGVATAQQSIQSLADDSYAIAQSVLDLQASFGAEVGQTNAKFLQVNQAIADEQSARTSALQQLTTDINGQFQAQSTLIQSVQSDVTGNAQSISQLGTKVNNLEGFTEAQLLLNSEYNQELETLVSRAFLGVTTVVNGVATVAGLTINGGTNAILFRGGAFGLENIEGDPVLYWTNAGGVLNIRARLVLSGGETVDKIEDIRALDGNFVDFRYRANATQPAAPTAVNPTTSWSATPPNTTDPIWVTQATKNAANTELVTPWSTPVRWNGLQGAPGIPGAPGSNGSDGTNAKVVKLVGDVTAVSYNAEGTGRSVNAISFVATSQNVNTPFYRFYVNDQAQGTAATTTSTFSYSVPSNYFATPVSIEVEVREGSASGPIVARDEVTVYAVKDGKDVYTVILSNEAHTVPTDSAGANGNFAGSGTEIRVYQGSVLLTFAGTSASSYPTAAGTYRITRTLSNLSGPNMGGTGSTVATQGDYTGMTADNATASFAVRIRNLQGVNVASITKTQTLGKSKQGVQGVTGSPGAPGQPGLNSATLTAYKRSASAPTDNAGNVTYTFATSAWTPANGWSKTIPATNGQPLWAISASAASNTAADDIAAAEWSAPTKMLEDGADGLNVATVFLYRRTTGATPALPNANITYTFATGAATGLTNSWTRDIPTTGGAYLWVTQATASSQGATDVIAPSEWSAVAKLAADGLDGTNARVITLFATKQAIAYRKDGSRDANSINFDTTMQSLSGGIYEFQLQCFRADGTFSPATANSDGSVTNPNLIVSGGSATLNTSSSYSVFNPNNEFVYYRMRVRYLVGGVSQAEDVVSIGKVYDGSEAITVVLSNESHTLPAGSTGTVSSMVGSGTTIKVYQGANLLTFRGVGSSGSSYPTQNSSFTINRTYSANMRDAGTMSGDGTTTATQPDYGNVAGDGSVTDWTEFAIRIRDADGRELPAITKRQTLSKSKQGVQGGKGDKGDKGDAGNPGPAGAGFYGSTYSAISWTAATANQRFTELTGRAPVTFDVFTQTRADGTDSQARQYNGSSWEEVALQVNGSIIAKGTIAGDRFIAGTEISSPIIKGGEVIVADSAVEYMSVIRATPFGLANDLVEWFGPRINGVTWNSTTMLPIYNGMTKLNAKTYKTKNGDVFFGGTFQAGVLSIARQATNSAGVLLVNSDPFTIPNSTTAISVTSSLTLSGSQLGVGSCPANLPSFNLVVNIERLVGGTWQNIGGNNTIITASCVQDGQEMIIELTGGVTVNTNLGVSPGQSISLRATATAPAFPAGIGGLNLQGTRSLSLVVSGA